MLLALTPNIEQSLFSLSGLSVNPKAERIESVHPNTAYHLPCRDGRRPTFNADELLSESRPLEWQTADIDVDAMGSVQWVCCVARHSH